VSILRLKAYLVRSSHIREDCGENIMHPSEIVPLDYKSIKESDIFWYRLMIALLACILNSGGHLAWGRIFLYPSKS
jgi:hypothetical protein